ncbi:ankyrin repeat-containing domain protein [Rhexocercosporidium sp. MPI-PUGE-AT-0058]|nr:ankyrin repeat-containing domain protein [Rhexocercosporidium sp. MPI-PUGE-AT-0058]
MDPLSLTVATITLAGASVTTASSVNNFCTNYREAEKQGAHVKHQRVQLQRNRTQLSNLSPELRHNVLLTQPLADLEAAIPHELKTSRRRDKLRWAAGRKSSTGGEIARLKETENSTIFALVLTALEEIGRIKETLSTVEGSLSAIQTSVASHDATSNSHAIYQQKSTADLLDLLSYTLAIAHPRSNRYVGSKIHWSKWLNRYFGMKASLIVSRGDFHNTYTMFFRWPLIWTRVITGRMTIHGLWPNRLSMSLRPLQIISYESPIIEACKNNDLGVIQELFATDKAHPNDTTPDNLTLLRFAIRAGHDAVVKILLEQGADPNITFGARETSPLNNAFLCGYAEIIRILLNAGADLEYVNSRTWTSLSYLWDPELPNHTCTPEILDICLEKQFYSWDHADTMGWTPIHRAAAFGEGHHIRKLRSLGMVNFDRHTIYTHWLPIQCAARYGNVSTFNALMESFPLRLLLHLKDSRGWTLLHLAAQSGSGELISQLLERCADPNALSDPASMFVPGDLEYKELTPGTIAEHYGHGRAYADALRMAGYTGS